MISNTAKRLAQQNRFGRLDPPVLFALDEAPNVVPLPLHRLTSEARGLGITFVVCVRSRQQVDDVWTSTRGSIIWKNCKVKMTLPVANDGETLDLVSKLCGTYEAERQTLLNDKEGNVSASTVMETRPTFPLEAIRMLPDFTSLVLYGNHRPNEGVDQPVLGAEIGEACRSEGCEACRTVPPRAADGILVSRQNSKDGGEGVALDPLEGSGQQYRGSGGSSTRIQWRQLPDRRDPSSRESSPRSHRVERRFLLRLAGWRSLTAPRVK